MQEGVVQMHSRTGIIYVLLIAAVAILFLASVSGNAEEAFSLKRVGNIHPYADNAFRIHADEEGDLEIRIHDSICVYRILTQKISAGDTEIHWDGCGYNREKLYEKTYTITAELTTASGTVHHVSFDSPVEYPAQCLQYALPSSEVLYLDDPEAWFVEYRTVTKGTVVFEFVSSEDPDAVYEYQVDAVGGKIARKTFTDIVRKKQVPVSGDYNLTIYEVSRKEEKYESALRILDKSPEAEPVRPTGKIMPDRSMTDSEIWDLMMKPSVVVDIDSFRHQDVFSEPDQASQSLGTIHGQSQGVEVFRIDGEWALVGAWNHEEAAYMEGWVPLSRLKVEAPRGEYGLLIDKQKQTLTVYRNGKQLDTLLISTGRAEKNCLYQETSAGCFLTGYHRVNFSTNGKKYDYVIQYDGGNLLHQTPYDWGQQKKDFTLGRGYLGAKASHACIRIQPEPGPGGLNAYWLFTHLPYHTRVMILDDPWEHESAAAKLKRNGQAKPDLNSMHIIKDMPDVTDGQVVITFGGNIIPGGSRSFNSRNESFSVFAEKNGFDLPLSRIKQFFETDDLTCIHLGCIIGKDRSTYPADKGTYIASAGMEKILDGASVELVQMTDDSLLSSGSGFYDQTSMLIQPYAGTLESGKVITCMLKGHFFGFAGFSETEYLKDPDVIDRRIAGLKETGCERIVVLFSWNSRKEASHTIVQEAMAHRSIRAGADLVVGNCGGIVQGFDLIEQVPVIYSTGDLLNGSTSSKPRNQQGMLVRTVFNFESESDPVKVILIPILPYGSTGEKQNEYMPAAELSSVQLENAVGYIWQDSTDEALEHVLFFSR